MYAFAYILIVRFEVASISVTEARRRLFALVDEVGESHAPVEIHRKRGNAVLVAEEDWNAIQETLDLTSIPGVRESILEEMAEPDLRLVRPLAGELVCLVYPPGTAGCPQTR